MEITWTWNFLESVAAIFLFIAGIVILFKVIGFIWLYIMFKRG